MAPSFDKGDNTPHFGSDGFVLGPDEAGTLINDLREFLDLCQANNIFVNLVLWNGALMRNGNYEALLYDNDKLQSYIDNALVPLVQGLKDHPALAAWEPMNEPEGQCHQDDKPLADCHLNPVNPYTRSG